MYDLVIILKISGGVRKLIHLCVTDKELHMIQGIGRLWIHDDSYTLTVSDTTENFFRLADFLDSVDTPANKLNAVMAEPSAEYDRNSNLSSEIMDLRRQLDKMEIENNKLRARLELTERVYGVSL